MQINKHEPRIESLIAFLTEKTENSKGMISIEEKVRKEMNVAIKKKPIFENSFRSPGFSEKNELADKINSKKLPENVKL